LGIEIEERSQCEASGGPLQSIETLEANFNAIINDDELQSINDTGLDGILCCY